MGFTEYKDTHKQKCELCDINLEALEDYFGGGSHYWHLKCPSCDQDCYFDTHRFILEKAHSTAQE